MKTNQTYLTNNNPSSLKELNQIHTPQTNTTFQIHRLPTNPKFKNRATTRATPLSPKKNNSAPFLHRQTTIPRQIRTPFPLHFFLYQKKCATQSAQWKSCGVSCLGGPSPAGNPDRSYPPPFCVIYVIISRSTQSNSQHVGWDDQSRPGVPRDALSLWRQQSPPPSPPFSAPGVRTWRDASLVA